MKRIKVHPIGQQLNIVRLVALVLQSILWLPWAQAQNCGCQDCPLTIPNGQGIYEMDYIINGLVNDDLAGGQSVCQVNLQFEHVRLSNLEVFLISPDRTDTVQLIGPFVPFGAGLGTPSTTWDVSFVPCFADGGLANPDPGVDEVWNNSDPDWSTFFGGSFTGDYYPTDDNCLSQFDSGPANGTWTLRIVNNVPPAVNSGLINNFEVIVCDDTGFNCCQANGGTIASTGDFIGACIDDDLVLDTIFATYPGGDRPLDSDYGYLFAIAQNDIILEFQENLNLTNFPAGEYTIKGLSYNLADAPLPVEANGNLTLLMLQDTLDEVEPIFCGDLSDDEITVVIQEPPPLMEIDTSICQGDTFTVGNSTFFEEGTFFKTFTEVEESYCDSTLQINLTVIPWDTTDVQASICAGESFTFGGQTLNNSGLYEMVLAGTNTCDSLVRLNLEVLPELMTTIDTTICAGTSVTVGNQSYTTTGAYPIMLNSADGCDSLVTLNLNVEQYQAVIRPPELLACNNPEVVLDGSISSTGPNVMYNWTTPDGNILSGGNTIQATVDAPGTYTLRVQDTVLGCEVIESITVDSDFTPPVANAGMPDTINCIDDFVRLNPNTSTANNALQFQWLSPNNDSLLGSTPMATEAGIYTLIATDAVNGCVDSSSVRIAEATDVPFINLPDSLNLVCTSGIITLDASNSAQGPEFTYEWRTANGNIVSDDQAGVAQADIGGVYTLTITNRNTGCINSASVTVVDNCTPTAIANAVRDTVNCFTPSTTLSNTGSSVGNNFDYRWLNAAGDTLSTTGDFTTNQGGTYVLWVRNNLFNTIATDTLVIFEDKTLPIADAGADLTLTCTTLQDTLDASNSSQGVLFDYQWLTFDGNFVNTDTSLQVVVDEAGVYTLEVTNLQNGCVASDNVAVQQMTNPPDICLTNNALLFPCTENTLELNANCPNPDANVTYNWTTTNGSILSTPDLSTISVGQAGTYRLSAENTMTGCVATDSVVVQFENCNLQLATATPDTLSCSTLETPLSATISPMNSNYRISWTTNDGNLIGNPNQLNTTANAPGTYTLIIEDTLRNTQTSIDVQVFADTLAPQIDAGLSPALTCDATSVQLNASADASAVLSWMGDAGQAIQNDATLTPTVSTAGMYVLQAVNPRNGCIAQDSVEVLLEQTPPQVDAGSPQQLTCENTSIQLDATNSSNGADFRYTWSTSDGNIASGSNSPTPTITAPGTFILTIENTANGCSASDTTTVAQDASLPQIDAGAIGQITCAEPEFQIEGQGPTDAIFDIQWTPLDGGNIVRLNSPYQPVVDQPGRYALQVANTTTGCTSTDTVEVLNNARGFNLSIDMPGELSCDITEVSLIASITPIANYTFGWQSQEGNAIGNATTASATVNAPGTYTLTATDVETGCMENASVTVTGNTTTASAFAGRDTSLTCTRTMVLLQGSSNQQNVAFTWTDINGNLAGNNSSLPVNNPGQYVFTVRNLENGCVEQDTVNVTENRIIPTALVTALNGTTLDCETQELTLSGRSSSPTGNLNYRWVNSSQAVLGNDDRLTVNSAGEYTLRVTDTSNGCTDDISITIESDQETPDISIASPPVVPCTQPTVQLEATLADPTDILVAWVNTSGDTIADILNPEVPAGSYTLVATNQRNNCAASETVIVEAAELPQAQASNPQNAEFTCDVTEITLSAEGSEEGDAIQLQWLRQNNVIGSGSTFAISEPGWYILQVTNTATSCVAVDSILVEGEPGAIETVELVITPPACTEEASGQIAFVDVLGGVEPYMIAWNGQPFLPINTIERLTPGTYDLQLQDSNGCEWDSTVVLNSPTDLDIDLGEDIFITIGDSVSLEPLSNTKLFNIQWSSTDTLSCSNCPTLTVQPTTETTYTVTAENEDGCIATDAITIRVDRSDLLYIPNVFSPNGDGQNDQFFINARPEAVEEIEIFRIFDRWGTLVHEAENIQPNDPTQAWEGMHRGKALPPAVYVYYAKVRYLDGRSEVVEGDVALIR